MEKSSHSAFTPLGSKNNIDSHHSRDEMYNNFLSPDQILNNKETMNDYKCKEDKIMFSISAEKTPFRRSPTPHKKELKYSASGAKIYKEDIVESDLNNPLFSQDLAEDENNKSPFSFFKRTNPIVQMVHNTKNREAFNNITNTMNKSHMKEEKDILKRTIENFVPKSLNFDPNKSQHSATHS